MKFLRPIILCIFLSSPAFGAYKGDISFLLEEKQVHRERAYKMTQIAAECLQRYKREHEQFYRENCFKNRSGKKICLSKFYGDRRYSKHRNQRRSDGAKLEYLPDVLKSLGVNPRFASKMRSTSCVGLALECLGKGFSETGQEVQWQRVKSFVVANGVGGTSLQHALSRIGWHTYYWNPSPHWRIESDAKKWDAQEKNWQSKGWHFYRYRRVMTKNAYWFNSVDNANDLVGFEKSIPGILYSYPFWVGTAHTGYHVFPGTFEKVVEAHSTRHITSFNNLEFSDFNPMASGGGPRWTRTEKYRSGLFALPPLF